MRQPIALEIMQLKEILSEPNDYDKFESIYYFLKKYHEIWYDKIKNSNKSYWLKSIDELRKSIRDQNIKSIFDRLFLTDSRIIRIQKILEEIEGYTITESVATLTPDKLILSNKKTKKIKILNYIDFNEFIKDTVKPSNVLFRIPKIILLKKGYKLKNFNFLLPYLRNAEKLEFMDRYLFGPRSSGIDAILAIIKLSKNVSEIVIYRDSPPSINIIEKKFRDIINSSSLKVNLIIKNYDNDEYHGRNIIVNNNEFSLTPDASFNNIVQNGSIFLVKKNFKFTMTTGRH